MTDLEKLNEYASALELENERLRVIVRAATSIRNRDVWNYEQAVQNGHIMAGALESAMEELRAHFALIEGNT